MNILQKTKNFLKNIMLIVAFFTLFGCKSVLNNDKDNYINESYDLTVFSGHSESLTEFYLKEYREISGLNINVVSAQDSSLEEIINSESADVVIGVAGDTLQLYNNHFIKPNITDNIQLKDDTLNLDKNWISDARLAMVIVYNKQLLSNENAPHDWIDLLKPHLKGKIAIANPLTSGSSYTQLVTLLTVFNQNKEKNAWDYISELIEQTDGDLFERGYEITNTVISGEKVAGISLENYAIEKARDNPNIEIVYPKSGTTVRSSGIAILKSTKNIDKSTDFINFILDSGTQRAIATNYYRRPTNINSTTPSHMKKLSSFNQINYDYIWAASNKKENLSQWSRLYTECFRERK